MGKVAHLCRVETYSNSPCPRYWVSYGVVSQLVFHLGMDGLACVVLEMCPAAVPCATADEESGSSLKLELRVTQYKNWFLKCFPLNKLLHKI